jgi:hypothetical protein
VKLPALTADGSTVPDIWPPQVQNHFGLEYAAQVAAAFCGAAMPQTEAERISASERHLANYMEMERESRRLSAEASSRAHAHETEQRRLRAGG